MLSLPPYRSTALRVYGFKMYRPKSILEILTKSVHSRWTSVQSEGDKDREGRAGEGRDPTDQRQSRNRSRQRSRGTFPLYGSTDLWLQKYTDRNRNPSIFAAPPCNLRGRRIQQRTGQGTHWPTKEPQSVVQKLSIRPRINGCAHVTASDTLPTINQPGQDHPNCSTEILARKIIFLNP